MNARIECLKVQNFRALQDVEFKDLTPLTVLVGPNGSGKSTVLDVLDFLSESFETGLRYAWYKRGRAKELKTRSSNGPLVIELKYSEVGSQSHTYHLAIDERAGTPIIVEEWLQSGKDDKLTRILDYREGSGWVVSDNNTRKEVALKSPDLLAVNAFGQFKEYQKIAWLRKFINGWYISNLSFDSKRIYQEASPHEHLNKTGDNLANVIQFLTEQHGKHLKHIFETLRKFAPYFERAITKYTPDGRLLLQIKEAPFDQPIPAQYVSDGTLNMLSYLVLLRDPAIAPLICLKNPENHLHPHLLTEFAEECRAASTQLLMTTHSPVLVNSLRQEEVHLLWRDDHGYTKTQRVCDIPGADEFIDQRWKSHQRTMM